MTTIEAICRVDNTDGEHRALRPSDVPRYSNGEEAHLGDSYLDKFGCEQIVVGFENSIFLCNARGVYNISKNCTLLHRAGSVAAPPQPAPSPCLSIATFTELCCEVASNISKDVSVVTDTTGSNTLLLWLRLPGCEERVLAFRAADTSSKKAVRSEIAQVLESYLRETDPRRKR